MKLFLLFFIICIAAALQQEDGKKGLSKRRKSFSVGNLRKPIKAGKKVPKNNRKKKRKNNIAAKKRTTRIRKTGRKQAGKKVPKNKSKKKRKNNIAAKKRTARNRKTGRKQGKKTKATLSGRQQNSTTWETCFENSVTALRRYKDTVANFKRQLSRITRQNGTAASKYGSKNVFQKVYDKIITIGGGDKTNLSCSGSYSGAGWTQMKNLSMVLQNCSTEINRVCNVEFPKVNQSTITRCKQATDDFSTKADSCLALSGNASCSCWNSASMLNSSDSVRGCRINEVNLIAAGLKTCQDAFRKCRKYEDASISTIATCSVDTAQTKIKAASLNQNIELLKDVVCYWCDWTPLGVTCPAKCPNIVIIGKKYNKGTSTNRLGNFRVVPKTCAGLVTVVTELATVATTYPTSHQVSYLAVDAILADIPSCSNLEITTLKAQMTSLQSAEANMASMLNATQTALLASTGTTASTAELSAAVPEVPGAGTSGAGVDGTIVSENGTVVVVAATTTTTKKPTTTTTMKTTTTTKAAVAATTTVAPCASGWKHHGHSCYKFVTTTKTWDGANSDCSCTNKARLVDIRTKEEQAFVKNLTGGVSAWIGARDNMTEGMWTWSVDNSTLKSNSYNKWTGSKYPVADYTKNCGELTTAGEWDDVKCSTLKGYICKKPDNTHPKLPTASCPIKQLCEAGWLPWGSSCYKLSASNIAKPFYDSQKSCIASKARLADIRSTGEHEFIKSITGGTAAWLGATDNGTESHWRWTFDNSSISSIKFNKWTGSKIPAADYTKNCMEMTATYTWSAAKCSTAKHYVCKKPNKMMAALPTVTPIAICDAGWTQWGTSCYKLETTVKSWDDARTVCVCTESADLVDVQSAAEDGFLQALTGGTAAIWLGGTDDTQENLWTWSYSNVTITHGKDQYTYKNFKTDPTYDVTNNCLEKTTAGTWSAATCSTTKQYVCKKPDLNQPLQFAKTTSQTAGCKLSTKSVSKCDSGWTHQGTSCYKKMTTAASFDKARRECACTNAGDLVSIHTLEENRFIQKLAGSTEIWLGGRDFVTEGTFTWTDGSSGALFEQKAVWTGSALPTTTANLNDWVYMGTDGTWTVSAISSSGTLKTKQYICKKQDKDQLGPMKLPTPTNYGTSLGCGTCSGTEWGLAKDTYPSLDTGKCYKAVIITTNNAASSLTACSAAPAGITSATLATITSPLENAVLLSYLTAAQATPADLWIGATAGTVTTGDWKWTKNGLSTQSTFPYSNWATAAGDGTIAADDPVFMYTDGTWKYLTDTTGKGSLCEGTATAATSG